jgi:hypothetical protein
MILIGLGFSLHLQRHSAGWRALERIVQPGHRGGLYHRKSKISYKIQITY